MICCHMVGLAWLGPLTARLRLRGTDCDTSPAAPLLSSPHSQTRGDNTRAVRSYGAQVVLHFFNSSQPTPPSQLQFKIEFRDSEGRGKWQVLTNIRVVRVNTLSFRGGKGK